AWRMHHKYLGHIITFLVFISSLMSGLYLTNADFRVSHQWQSRIEGIGSDLIGAAIVVLVVDGLLTCAFPKRLIYSITMKIVLSLGRTFEMAKEQHAKQVSASVGELKDAQSRTRNYIDRRIVRSYSQLAKGQVDTEEQIKSVSR